MGAVTTAPRSSQAGSPKHDGEPHVPPMHQDRDRGLRVTYPRHQERHPRQPHSP